MTTEKKKIVITGNTVLKFAGIFAIIAGTVSLIIQLFRPEAIDWIVSLVPFGAGFFCLYLAKEKK